MEEHTDCGSSLLHNLTDDVLAVIGQSLSIIDVCNLSMSCKSLHLAPMFDNFWLEKCEELGVLSSTDLVVWREAFLSYKALCRFLTGVKPLLGIWVNHNFDCGNVVYVMPGFGSVSGCRGIPRGVGPSEGGSILWAPVFEVISDRNGALSFVLHGRENFRDYIYPGTVKSIQKTCDVLLLDVEAKEEYNSRSVNKKSTLHSRISKWLRFADKSSVTKPVKMLSFRDRWKSLEVVLRIVRVTVSYYSTGDSLFPCLRNEKNNSRKEVAQLSKRREILIKIQELRRADDSNLTANDKNYSYALTLQASTMHLRYDFRGWPNTHGNLFALYKLPIQDPAVGQEYAGSWEVDFGWPPSKLTENKVLFFVILSYTRHISGQRFISATKIFEGAKDVPCSRCIFDVNVDKPSTESFPWNSGVTRAFTGRGDGNGYGIGSAGSTPGTLFVLEDGVLAFVWTETKSVVTLQRVNLDEVFRNGQRVPPLPPLNNFSYMYSVYRSYPDVFTLTDA